MIVMVIGSGAREHALAWKLSTCELVDEVICCPGNPGIARKFRCITPTQPGILGYLQVALAENVGLTVVGPEVPLVEGIVDMFHDNRLKIFGPSKEASMRTEGSKVSCANMLKEAGVPMPHSIAFSDPNKAKEHVMALSVPCVIKADGLAAGKGVTVCDNTEQALQAIDDCMVRQKFGQAGESILIQERLVGEECSFMILTDGRNSVPLWQAQDYKYQKDGNLGPMTGGMGSFCPTSLNATDESRILNNIVCPTLNALRDKFNAPYQGVMYFGLMLTAQGPKVLEINCRFGDPETQVILPLLKTDLLDLMLATLKADGLKEYVNDKCLDWYWSSRAVGVVLAAPGYPGEPQTGQSIYGIEDAKDLGAMVFCAGVESAGGTLRTAGGRVLTIVGTGNSRKIARDVAYQAASKIEFVGGKQLRTDIGA